MSDPRPDLEEYRQELLPADYHRPDAVKHLTYLHDVVIDMMLQDPSITRSQIAKIVGKSPTWVGNVQRSEVFKARLAERAGDVIDPLLYASVKTQFENVSLKALEILSDRLEQDGVPDTLVIRALEVTARSLGYGANGAQTTNVQVNGDVHLQVLGENLVRLLKQKKAEAGT